MKRILCFFSAIVFLSGCQSGSVNPKQDGAIFMQEMEQKASKKASAIMDKNPEADIFMFTSRVYKNAENSEWAKKDLKHASEPYTQGITEKYGPSKAFTHGMATKLPIGTKLFQVPGQPVIYAEFEGKKLPYIEVE